MTSMIATAIPSAPWQLRFVPPPAPRAETNEAGIPGRFQEGAVAARYPCWLMIGWGMILPNKYIHIYIYIYIYILYVSICIGDYKCLNGEIPVNQPV